jgi:hypothetical protein
MATGTTTSRAKQGTLAPKQGRGATGRTFLAALGFAALAALVLWWTLRALNDHRAWDFNPAFFGGRSAWANGHPEYRKLWDGTPLLATVMAVVARVVRIRAGGELITVLNAVLVVAGVSVLLRRLRGQVSSGWWWVIAFGLLSFGPMMSTVWWKQFNIIALVLAAAGFELLRQRRTPSAAALIGLSVAIKPLLVLLPFVLLARRETRRAGAMALGWLIALSIAGQAFLAIRAGQLSVLDPLRAIHNFIDKTGPSNGWACKSLNFAPGSMLCRLMGDHNWTLQRVAVLLAVAVLAAWVIDALRDRPAAGWEVFAFTCPISVMISPLDWAHYQVLLAPLFVLLLVRFVNDGAGIGSWVGLATAFVLASLMWEPYGTLPGAIRGLFAAHRENSYDVRSVDSLAQFAQYVLIITGLLWYAQTRAIRRRLPATRAA